MRTIAHISDLHFGRVDDRVVEALVDDLNAFSPDLVIISGDFTQRAKKREFCDAKSFVGRLEAPWFAVPGNHDISFHHLFQRFFDPWRRYRRYIHPVVEPVFEDDEIFVIGINTARRVALEFDWSHGRISEDQIARTARQLAKVPDHKFKIVVGHHPFLPPPYAPDTRVVGRADEAMRMFEDHGVRLALAGHLHRGYLRVVEPAAVDPRRSEPRPDGDAPLVVVQTASATSTRLREEPNAYQRIRIDAGKPMIRARVWNGETFGDAISVDPDNTQQLRAMA